MYNTALDTTNVVAGVVVAAGFRPAGHGLIYPKSGPAGLGVAARNR